MTTDPILPAELATCERCGQTALTTRDRCTCRETAPQTCETLHLFTAPQTMRGQLAIPDDAA